MKIAIALIVWMLISLILVCTVVGLVLFIRTDTLCSHHLGDRGLSTWSRIGLGLYEKIIKEK